MSRKAARGLHRANGRPPSIKQDGAGDHAAEGATDDDAFVDATELAIAAKQRRKSARELWRLLRVSGRLVWGAGKGTFLTSSTLQLLGGLIVALQLVVVQHVLGALIAVGNGTGTASDAIPSVLALAGVTAFSTVSAAVLAQQQRLLGELVSRATWRRVLDVAGSVSLRAFESSAFFDRLNRVQTNAIMRPYSLTRGVIGLLGGIAGSLGVAGYLLSLDPLLLPLLLLSGIPLWITGRMQSRAEFGFAVRQTPRIRLRMYLTQTIGNRDAAKELRAFGFGKALYRRWEGVYGDYVHDLRRHIRKLSILAFLGSITSAVVLAGTLGVMVWLMARGKIELKEAGAAIVAIRMMATQLTTLFNGVQQIFESGLFLEDLHDFFTLAPKAREAESGDPAPARFTDLQVDNLAFSYPGTDRNALQDISLRIRSGEVVALVGENGSGKTTLAKLLAALYEPDTGTIAWDGVDVRSYDREGLRRAIAVIFQDFMRYELTARENIAAGRDELLGDPRVDDAVMAAARQSGADDAIENLPRGLDTILSKAYKGGRDLSLGQWQRVALARAFIRNAPFVILDEPSSALDPRAEHDLFAHIRDLLTDRTVLFISHRFSTVRSADHIYVMKDGRIAEHGSHDELMAQEGLYADLFTLQAQAYLDPADRD